MPAPVVRPTRSNLIAVPVAREAEVSIMRTPAVEAVEFKSSKLPAVVPVSIPVEVTRSMDEPAPITEVV